MDIQQRNFKIVQMRRQGHTLGDIALEVGCSIRIVKETLDALYMTRHTERQNVDKRILELRARGHTVTEIAEQVGRSTDHVYRVLRLNRRRQGQR